MHCMIEKTKNMLSRMKRDNISEYASACAYFTILAFIPLIMLILTLTKYVGIEQSTLFFIIEKVMSRNILNDAVLGIVKEVYSKSVGTITISAVFVLWSAGKGFLALCKGLDAAYEVKKNERFIYFRLRATICTLIFILIIILVLLLLVFGNSINQILKEKFNVVSTLISLILKGKILISIIFLLVVFLIMYRFIPKHKYKIKQQIYGAVFSAIACTIISIFYSAYVSLNKGFSVMYGSLTTIVLAMMWVYACMYSILLGAKINKYIIDQKERANNK